MKTFIVLLIVAGFAPAALAREGQRPPARPKPAERAMLPCPEFGPGFVRAPGSATCARVGGQVRVDGVVRDRRSSLDQGFGAGGRARFSIDARTPTDFGPARVYVRPQARF